MRRYLYILFTILVATIVAAAGFVDMPQVLVQDFGVESLLSEDMVPSHEEDQLQSSDEDPQSILSSRSRNNLSSQHSQSTRQLSRRSIIKTSNSTAIIEGKTCDCRIVFAQILNQGLLPLAAKSGGVLLLRLRKLLI